MDIISFSWLVASLYDQCIKVVLRNVKRSSKHEMEIPAEYIRNFEKQ